jgi:hypothetical protein
MHHVHGNVPHRKTERVDTSYDTLASCGGFRTSGLGALALYREEHAGDLRVAGIVRIPLCEVGCIGQLHGPVA